MKIIKKQKLIKQNLKIFGYINHPIKKYNQIQKIIDYEINNFDCRYLFDFGILSRRVSKKLKNMSKKN